MRLKLVGEAIFQPGRILGTVAGKSVVLGGRSALSAIAIAEYIFYTYFTGGLMHTLQLHRPRNSGQRADIKQSSGDFCGGSCVSESHCRR